jgi:hypothetical protein
MKLRPVSDCVQLAVPQPTKWQRIGNLPLSKKLYPQKQKKYYEKTKLNRSNMSFELAKIMRKNGRSDSLPSSANVALDHAENSVNPHAMW